MVRVITIASIKGGVGKTTIAENLGIVLGRLRRRVLIVDSDLATSGLTTLIGLTDREPNLHDLLAGRGDVNKAVCDAYGIQVLPSGPSIGGFVRADPTKLAGLIDNLKRNYDYVIIDTPPGLSKYSLAPLKLADDILLVATQDPSAVEAAARLEEVAQALALKIHGVVVNRVRKSSFFRRLRLLTKSQIQSRLKAKIISGIPEDASVAEAATLRRPIVLYKPKSDVSKAIRLLATKLGA
ncbi:MAG: AAA family ATPase [Hadesarchaea archaeon]|nr:AAA family ATPase [Hadesarchaea archaeon]